MPWDGFELHIGDTAFAGVFPTHFGEACVWLIRPEPHARPVLTVPTGRSWATPATTGARSPGTA